MTDTVTALVLAGLAGVVLSALFFFAMLGRRTRAAFEDGLQRQAERANADHQLLEERLDAKGRENVRLEQALKAATQSLAQQSKTRIGVCSPTTRRWSRASTKRLARSPRRNCCSRKPARR